MDRITRIAPSARLQQQIEELLTNGLGEQRERLAELGRLGARLVLQQAVDEEVAAFLGRARYERTLAATGSRNGTRPKPIQTAEGEISIAMPQVRRVLQSCEYAQRVLITDKLASYAPAIGRVLPRPEHRRHKRLKNRQIGRAHV